MTETAAIIGGTGVYSVPGLDLESRSVSTEYGAVELFVVRQPLGLVELCPPIVEQRRPLPRPRGVFTGMNLEGGQGGHKR